MFTRLAQGAVYMGIDPTGKRGFIRVLVADMTREQLAAWVKIDAATASRYVNPAALKDEPVPVPIIDNNPGQPVPTITKADERKRK